MAEPVSRDDFLSAMRNAATSVSVVTTDGPGGRYGVTVGTMASVSADPPAVLVCIRHENWATEAALRNGVFCVNVLSDTQHSVAKVFAGCGEPRRADRFGCFRWNALETGAPALPDAAAVFDCRLADEFRFGSHTILVGVVAAVRTGSGRPLVYHNRAYGHVSAPMEGPDRDHRAGEPA